MYNFYKFTKKDGIFHIYINIIFYMAAEEKIRTAQRKRRAECYGNGEKTLVLFYKFS